MFATSLAVLAALAPQGSLADAPHGLVVVVVAVGQGDGIVIRAPDGRVHCVDGGPNGQGTAAMLPAIAALQPTSYGFTFLSHFHDDHQGGLDEVLAARPFTTALDRGDVNRPSNPGVNAYLAAAGARRQTIQLGAVYALGGGASLRCVAGNGAVAGGAFVDPTTSSQEENSRSIALRLEYGAFSMWLGGDLTGGGSQTADVETPATLACGDVDVCKLNHHGSNTSNNAAFVAQLQPELAVVSCGLANPYGYPPSTVVNRVNQALAARALLATTTGSAATIGFGVAGTIRIDTDGRRYRATAHGGDFLDFWCDEATPPPPAAGALRIAEVHRDPAVVPDTNGEYVEVVNVGAVPVGLRGLRLSDNAGTVTIASNFLAVPGRPLLFQVDAAPSRNGGQPLGVPLPFGALALANTTDGVTLLAGGTTLDAVAWGSGFPGGSGVAAERRDLRAAAGSAANWAAAPNPFGLGDRGSPGVANAADATVHPVQVAATAEPGLVTLHATALDHGGPFFSALVLAHATTPATPFGGALIPLAFDPLFQASVTAPGFVAVMPALGYRSVDLPLPQPNPLQGLTVHAAHVVVDWTLAVPGLSGAIAVVLP